jgi:hypothetical protein
MKKKKQQKVGACVYCGEIKPLTDDHVPPRSLFPRPWPSNLITVPSCADCNCGSSKDDEYFRLLISAREDTGGHTEVTKIHKKILSSLLKPNKVGFRKSVLASVNLVERKTPSGLYIGKSPAIDVDMSRIKRVARRIVKGLFYQETKIRLPSSYEAVAFPIEYKDFSDQIVSSLIAIQPRLIGNGVFSYRGYFLEDDPNESAWLMFFYEGAPFIGGTIPISDASKISMGEA